VDDNARILDWLAGLAERVIDTPAARIALVGDRALKAKKAVDFGFLDYATPERRRWAVEREFAYNREGAPDLYRAVRTVTREPDGFALDGPGVAVETVLEMRRFADDAVLAVSPERLDGDLAEALGRTVARAHAASAPDPEAGGTEALGYTVRSNAEHLRTHADRLGRAAVGRLIEATDAAFARFTPAMEARRAAGLGRRCHGDLHLGNILVEDGRPTLFDCIEFNDRLSRIDVLYDLAFLLMDLEHRSRGDAAVRVLSGWLDEAQRSEPNALVGFEALPLFLSVRSAVRAHVAAANGETESARAYVAAAESHLAPPSPRLLAVGGLSGSGKSTYARAAAPTLGTAAAIVRSDEVRKRLWGVGPTERLPSHAYAAGESERVYARMLTEAAALLAAGRSVVLDGVFLRQEERAAVERLAAERGVAFEGVWLQADPEVLRARVEARSGDASDATPAVVDAQLARDPGPMRWAVKVSPGPPSPR
jgi:aminoglycoside phosphotransferase family enzyme/predicted kinase